MLLWTGTDEHRDNPDYPELHPGMSIPATEYLLDRGVRVIAIDAFGFDRPFSFQVPEFKAGKRESLMPCHHILGRQREYFQIEQITNIGAIPKPHGFKNLLFPDQREGRERRMGATGRDCGRLGQEIFQEGRIP